MVLAIHQVIGTTSVSAQDTDLVAQIPPAETQEQEQEAIIYGPHYKPDHHVATLPLPQTVEQLICSYQWPCQQALRIARCESTMNPRASAHGNHGLFQINQIHAPQYGVTISQLYDPQTNVRIAYDLYQRRGWQPWQYCSR